MGVKLLPSLTRRGGQRVNMAGNFGEMGTMGRFRIEHGDRLLNEWLVVLRGTSPGRRLRLALGVWNSATWEKAVAEKLPAAVVAANPNGEPR